MSSDGVGTVLEIFISEKEKKSQEKLEFLRLESRGVVGDKFYDKEINRSVLISSIESYNLVKEHDIEIDYGQLGENILLDYNPYALTVGTKIKIGTAVLAITQNCTICNHLSVIDKKLPKLLRHDRGIFAKVIEEGEIFRGEKVYIL